MNSKSNQTPRMSKSAWKAINAVTSAVVSISMVLSLYGCGGTETLSMTSSAIRTHAAAAFAINPLLSEGPEAETDATGDAGQPQEESDSVDETAETSDESRADDPTPEVDDQQWPRTLTESVRVDDEHYFTVTVTYDKNAGVDYDAHMTVANIDANDEHKVALFGQLGIGDSDHVAASSFLKVQFEADGKAVQPAAPIEVIIETNTMDPACSDAIEASMLGYHGAVQSVENLTGQDDEGGEADNPGAVKLKLSAQAFGEIGLAAVTAQKYVVEDEGETVVVYGPRSTGVDVQESVPEGETVNGLSVARILTITSEVQHAWTPYVWIAEHKESDARGVACWQREGGQLTTEVFGLDGTNGFVATPSNAEYVLLRKVESAPESQPDAVEDNGVEVKEEQEKTTQATADEQADEESAQDEESSDENDQQAQDAQQAQGDTKHSSSSETAAMANETQATADDHSLKQTYTASDGRTYRITVDLSAKAGIPANAELVVSEVAHNSTEYLSCVTQAENALEAQSDADSVVRALDITLKDPVTGKELQPTDDARVCIELLDEELNEYASVGVVHIHGKSAGEAEEAEVLNSSVRGEAIEFSTDGFSVYVLVLSKASNGESDEPKTALVFSRASDESSDQISYAHLADDGTALLSDVATELGITEDVESATVVNANPVNSLRVTSTEEGWILATTDEFRSGTITINGSISIDVASKRAIVIKADHEEKIFGNRDPVLTATITGVSDDDDTSSIQYALSRETGEDVGTYTITPAGEAVQGDYAITYETGMLTITPKNVTVRAENKKKTYGENDPTLTAKVVNLLEGDSVTYVINRAEGENVGDHTITPSGDEYQGNYKVKYESGTLTIDRAPVTVKANNKEKVAGTDDPIFTAKVTGLKRNDPESLINYTLARPDNNPDNTGYSDREKSGEHAIVPTGDETQGNYTVTFENGVLTIEKLTITFKNGDDPVRTCRLELNQPIGEADDLTGVSKTGCDFEGWYSGADKVTSQTAFTADTELQAHFTVNVSFDDGTSTPPTPVTIAEGAQVGTLPEATKEGYRFDGWYANRELTGHAVTTEDTFNVHTTLYAKFVEQVTVGFEVATTEADGTTTAPIGEAVQIDKGTSLGADKYPTVTVPNGYAFKGWFVGSTQIDDEGSSYTFNVNSTVTARVVRQTTVTYKAENAQGGLDTFGTDTGDVNRSVSFPTPAPTLAGADFKGWYDGDSQVSDHFTADTDKTLTAHYTVTANFLVKSADYTSVISTTPVVIDKDTAIGEQLLHNPVLEGYKFKGWFIADSEGKPGDTQVTANTAFNVHTTVVAKFVKQVTIVFETEVTRHEYTVDAGDTVPLVENPVKPDTRFDGWFDQNNHRVSTAEGVVDGEGNLIKDEDGNPVRTLTATEDMTLTPRFIDLITIDFLIVHPVTMSSSGTPSVNSHASVIIDKGGKAEPFPGNPLLSGYVFQGWYGIKRYEGADKYSDIPDDQKAGKFVLDKNPDGIPYVLDEDNPIDAETVYDGDTIVVAKFAHIVNITFQYKTGMGTDSETTVNKIKECVVGEPLSASLPAEAQNDGYRIEWYKDGNLVPDDYIVAEDDNNKMVGADYIKQITLTFKDEGHDDQVIAIDEGTSVSSSGKNWPTDPAPETGLHFMGWYAQDGVKYDANTTISENVTLSAWYGHEVSFYARKGDSESADVLVLKRFVKEGSSLGWLPDDPFWEGHTFLGWKLSGEAVASDHEPAGDEKVIGLFDGIDIYTVVINYVIESTGTQEDSKTLVVNKSAVSEMDPIDSPESFTTANGPVYPKHGSVILTEEILENRVDPETDPDKKLNITPDPTDDHKLTITVYYTASNMSYTIRYMLKNLTDDGYTAINGENVTKQGVKNAVVIPAVKTFAYADVDRSSVTPTTLTTDGQLIDVKYTRKDFVLSFDARGGIAVASHRAPYGGSVDVGEDTSTRSGYTFEGWYASEADAEALRNPVTSVTLNSATTLYAGWTPATVKYTVMYLKEVYGEAGFQLDKSQIGTALVGTELKAGNNTGSLTDMNGYEKVGQSVLDADPDTYPDSTVVVKADGSTILKVYFRQIRYTLEFKHRLKRDNYNYSNATLTHNGTRYTNTNYIVTDVVIGQNISALWPTNVTSGRTGYSFYGWDYTNTNNGTTTRVTKVLELTWELVEKANSSTHKATFNANYKNGLQTQVVLYWLQQPDGSYSYDNDYSQWINLSSTSLGAKSIEGYTRNESKDTKGYEYWGNPYNTYYYTYNFYYDRGKYNIYFYNDIDVANENTLPDQTRSDVLFEADIHDIGYTPAKPSGKEDYTWAGWYKEGASEPFSFDGAKMPAHDLKLYGKWNAPEYTITFHYNYPGVTPEVTSNQTIKKNSVPTDPKDSEGFYDFANAQFYEFDGWFTEADGETYYNFGPLTANTEVYAHWTMKPLSYTVRYVKTDGSELSTPKTVERPDLVPGDTITEKPLDIRGYIVSSQSTQLPYTLGIDSTQNVITFVYAERPGTLNYTVHYYVKGTTDRVAADKVAQVDGTHVVVTELAATPDSEYSSYRPEHDSQEFTLKEGNNEFVFYYARNSAKVKVSYVDMLGTNIRDEEEELHSIGSSFDLNTDINGYTRARIEVNGTVDTTNKTHYTIDSADDINIRIVYQKNLTIRAKSVDRSYNGSPLLLPSDSSSVVYAGLKDGHKLDGVTITNAGNNQDPQTNSQGQIDVGVGTAVPSMAVIIEESTGTQVTAEGENGYYRIKYYPGNLSVTKINVIISLEPDRWTGNIYDGTEKPTGFTNPEKTIDEYIIISNDQFKAEYLEDIWSALIGTNGQDGKLKGQPSGQLSDGHQGLAIILGKKDAGNYYEPATTFDTALKEVFNELNVDSNYNITAYARECRLEIKPVALQITTNGKSGLYNGLPLTESSLKVEVGSGDKKKEIEPNANGDYTLVTGDTVAIRTTGSQTRPGTSQNIYEITWGTDENPVKHENYNLSENLGVLEVAACPILIEAQDAYKAFGAASDPAFAVKVYPAKLVTDEHGQEKMVRDGDEIPAILTHWVGNSYTLQLNDSERGYTDNLSIQITRDRGLLGNGDTPGTYAITPAWADDAVRNYDVTFVDGKLTIGIARVSNDNGATWTYHQWLEKADYNAETDDPSVQGAFDKAKAIGGNVIVETLCRNETFGKFGISDRYILGEQVALPIAAGGSQPLSALTLRTSIGADFTSTISRGFTEDSLFQNGCAFSLANITLDGGSPTYACNGNGGLVYVQPGGSLNVNAGATLQNSTTSGSGGAVYVDGSNADGSRSALTIKDGALITGNTAATGGNAVFVSDGCSLTMTGGAITENNNTDKTTGGAVGIGGADASLTFSGGAVIYNNLAGEAQHNVCLSYDSVGIINAAGLTGGDQGAKIGVFVKDTADASGAEDKKLFKDHGGVLDRFGTFTNDANLSSFVNDRNGLKGSARGTEEIIWVQPITVEARYMYNLLDYATMPTAATSTYTMLPSKYVVLADMEYVPTLGESTLTADDLETNGFTIDQIEQDIYNNYGGSTHQWSSASTNTMVFWRGYAANENVFSAYLDSLRSDSENLDTNYGKWSFDKNNDSSAPESLVPVDTKLVLYYTEPAYITVSNDSGLAMTNNNMYVALPGYSRTAGDTTVYNAPRITDSAVISVHEHAFVTKVGDVAQAKPYGLATTEALSLANEQSVTLMIPGAVGAMYWVDGRFNDVVEDVTLISVERNGGTPASNEKIITLNTLGTRYYPSTANPALPLSQADAYSHQLYGGLTQSTILHFGEAYICKITDADGNLLRVDNKIQAFKSLEEGFTAYNDNETNAYTRKDGTAATPTYLKMLVEDYDLKTTRLGQISAPLNKSVILTTAATSDEELPGTYEGTPETRCIINRGATCTSSMFSIPANANLTTKDIVFDGGAVFEDGAYVSGEVNVNGGIMNVAANGALIVDQGSTMQNTAVKSDDSNSAKKTGGAIYADTDSSLTITGTSSNRVEFTNCQANAGGAIFNPGTDGFDGAVLIQYSSFINCFAKGAYDNNGLCAGGAVRCMANTFMLDHCSFERCAAVQQGGAVFHKGATKCTVAQCDFESCRAGIGSKSASAGGLESQANTVVVDNCTFTECTSNKNAGALNVYKPGATINVRNSTFTRCKATGSGTGDIGNGGALRTTGKKTTVENCTFDSCEANNRGGAIHCKTSTTIKGTTSITNCKANIYGGGAVYLESNTLTIEAVAINNCEAPNGGAVYQGNGTLNMNAGMITDCTAIGSASNNNGLGGGVYLGGGTCIMKGGTITDCNAYSNGGGVCINATGAKFNLEGGTISGCNSLASGGGVYLGGGIFNLTDGQINTCHAKAGGGGVYISGSGTATISKNGEAIKDCKAIGVSVNAATGAFTVADTHDAGNRGGGLYQNGGTLTITNASISGCSAYDGGGIYLNGNSTNLSIGEAEESNGGAVNGCTASNDGGGIFLNNGTLNTHGGTSISENNAANGAGIYQGGGTLSINDGSIKSNVASDDGGGIYLGGGSFTLNSGEVGGLNADDTPNGGNEAKYGGGLFVADGASASIKGGKLAGNHATEIAGGGGIAIGGPNARLYFEGSIQVWGNTMELNPDYPNQKRCDVCLSEDSNEIIRTTAVGLTEESHIGVYVTDDVVKEGVNQGCQLHWDLHGRASMPFGTFDSTAGGKGDSCLNRFINNRSGKAFGGYEYYYGVRKPEGEEPEGEKHRIYWADYICEITDEDGNMLFTNNKATAPALYQYLGKFGAFEALSGDDVQFYTKSRDTQEIVPYTADVYYVRMLVLDYDLKWTETVSVPNKGQIEFTMADKDDENLPAGIRKQYDRKHGIATIGRGACETSMFTMSDGADLTLTKTTVEGRKRNENKVLEDTSVNVNGGLFNAKGSLTLGEDAVLQQSKINDSKCGAAICYTGDGIFTMNDGAMIQDCAAKNGAVLGVGGGELTLNSALVGDKDGDDDANVIRCTSTNGGAIYVTGSGTLRMDDSDASISHFRAALGGAIYVTGSSAKVSISDGTISHNESTSWGGGGIRIEGDAEVTVSGGTISNNAATGVDDRFGGAISVKKGALTISGGTISGNTVWAQTSKSAYGAAIHVSGANPNTTNDHGSLKITGGTITGNTANGGSAYGGAISVQGTNASVEISGGVITGNKAQGTNKDYYSFGGAVCVVDGGNLSLSGGTLTGNTAEGYGTYAGAGIYLADTAKMNISGAPTFHIDGEDENVVSINGYASKENGKESVYAGNKVRQDIYIAENHEDAPDSITVTGDLVDANNQYVGDGSIWVWAQHEAHYEQLMPFAKLADGVTFSTADSGSSSGFDAAHLKAFRNAQDDDNTKNSTDTYLYGTVKDDETSDYVYWTGVAGFRKVILRKVGEGNVSLAGAEFRIMSKSWKDIEKNEDGTGKTYTSDESGVYYVGTLPYGTYRLVETVFPNGYEPAGSNQFVEGDPSTYRYYNLIVGAEGDEITNSAGQQITLDARGTYVEGLFHG